MKKLLLVLLLAASPALAQFSLFDRVIAKPGAAVGDIYYTSTTGGVISRLGIGTTAYCLKVSGGLPAWSACSPLTTKGDIFAFSTVDARVAVGTDYQHLTADSASAAGVKWRSGFALIQTITTAASQATVDFTSIPSNCTDLQVRFQARSNVSAYNEALSLKFNNDGTAGNYTASQHRYAERTFVIANTVAAGSAGLYAGIVTGASATANHATMGVVTVPNYTGTTFYKQMESSVRGEWGASVAQVIHDVIGYWNNTAAVTRLTFSVPTSFLNGSRFDLYCVGGP
jgi:hypothetical protein